jgi:hypothetical protein
VTVAADAGAEKLALVGPLLDVLAVGSGTGTPLLCSVISSLVVSGLPDPNVAAAVAQIVAACGSFASGNAAALRGFATQLSALAAINPMANALIRQTAVLVRDLDPSLPYPDLADQLAALIEFFATDPG